MKIMDRSFNYRWQYFRIIISFGVVDSTPKLTLEHVTHKVNEVRLKFWMGGIDKIVRVPIGEDEKLVEVVDGLIEEAKRWIDGVPPKQENLSALHKKLLDKGFVFKS